MLATVVAIAVTVFAVYGRALDAPFIFDDRPGIVENPSIRRLWPLIGDATTPGPLNPPPLAPTARRPLPNLTLALNYRLGGLDPWGYRLVNVLLHVLTAALLAAVVRRTLRLRYGADMGERVAWRLALAVALLWAVHPLVTEAVVYVTQRTELLAACCCLITLWAALRHWTTDVASRRRTWLVVAGLASVAGMASKEFVAALPLIVLLYERTFLADRWRSVWRSWPLHLTLALGWILLVLLNASDISGMSDARHRIPLHVWWMTQAKTVLLYMKLAVWPWPLSIHYAPNYLRTAAEAWPWLAALAVVTTATLALTWRRPAARFVVFALVSVLAPTLTIPVPKMVAAERRMYLPLAGMVALAAVGGYRGLVSRWPGAGGRAGSVAAAMLVLMLASVSADRLRSYATEATIWSDVIRHQPDDPMAHYNLGVAMLEEGRPPQDAMPHFEQALRLDPENTGALDNLGMVLNALGRPQEALAHFERALSVEPDDVVAHNNIGAVLTDLGRPRDAVPHLRLALSLRPDEPKAKTHLNLGKALLAAGDVDDGVGHLENAVRLQPDDAELCEAVASALLSSGEVPLAVDYYRRALVLRPDYFEARNNLGAALLALGRPQEAIDQLDEALRAGSDHANAQYNLATALLRSGRPRDAIAHFREVLRLDPGDARARFQCATAYARAGDPVEAKAMAEGALALARTQGDTALAGEIDAWIAAGRAASSH